MSNQLLNGAFTIISLLPRPSGSKANEPSFQPNSIRRESDGEIFTIGDLITNENGMKGNIVSFDYLEDTVFVKTTWSNVGYSLDMAIKVILLPSQFQIHDQVVFKISQEDFILNGKGLGTKIVSHIKANVVNVHFMGSKIKYDLDIELSTRPSLKTRIYNVDSSCLISVQEYRDAWNDKYGLNSSTKKKS